MNRDQTLPDWTGPLQLLLKYFLVMPSASERGERRGFVFFFWGLTESTLSGGPRRAAGHPRAYKKPFGPLLAHFISFSPLLTLHKNFLECLELSRSFLSALVLYFSMPLQSFLHLRSVSVFLSSLIFYAKC